MGYVQRLSFDDENETVVGEVGVGTVEHSEIWHPRHCDTQISFRAVLIPCVSEGTAIGAEDTDRVHELRCSETCS